MPEVTDSREKVISIVKSRGPILPFQIAKEINSNLLIASAHLSELSSSNLVKISSIKVGGSPLYYTPGQEPKLQNFSKNLGEKEYRTYQLLQEKKILEDRSLNPVTRVCLRDIKDFAIPLKVVHNDTTYIFWKWYLLSNEEAEPIIKSQLEKLAPTKPQPEKQEIKPQPAKQPQQQPKQEQLTEQPKAIEPKKETPKQVQEDNLQKLALNFFENNNINIISSEIIKKNNDMELILELPSAFGNLVYFCKLRDKKKVTNTDLNNAYMRGQIKKLPVIYISTGDLSKKAEEYLEKNLKGVNFKKLE